MMHHFTHTSDIGGTLPDSEKTGKADTQEVPSVTHYLSVLSNKLLQ